MDFYLATEDALGEALGERLIVGTGPGLNISVRIGGKGNSWLRQKLSELVRVSERIPVLLLTDLDRIECPPKLMRAWMGNTDYPRGLLFRVVVREAESWLMADREAFSEFTGVPLNKVSAQPESLGDPKQTLLSLVGRYARRDIRSELLPAAKSTARVGHGYNQTLSLFVREYWCLDRAASRSDSLSRACLRVGGFVRSVAAR
jgi:hypothetical protein